jgi:hypothetical protein
MRNERRAAGDPFFSLAEHPWGLGTLFAVLGFHADNANLTSSWEGPYFGRTTTADFD